LHSNAAFVAAGFSLRCTGETPVPPREIGKKYSLGRNSISVVSRQLSTKYSWPLSVYPGDKNSPYPE
jgi:hypothetical protein